MHHITRVRCLYRRCLSHRSVQESINQSARQLHYNCAIGANQSRLLNQLVTVQSRAYTSTLFERSDDSDEAGVTTIGQKMFALAEAGRNVECIKLYERIFGNHTTEITEMVAYSLFRSKLNRPNVTAEDVEEIFLDILSRCPAMRSPALYNCMFETIAKKYDTCMKDHATHPSSEYPAEHIFALLESMKEQNVEPDFITYFHLAHITLRFSQLKEGEDYFFKFMRLREVHLKEQSSNNPNEYTGMPPPKVNNVSCYLSMFRLLIFLRKSEFASYTLKVTRAEDKVRSWMKFDLRRLSLPQQSDPKSNVTLVKRKRPVRPSSETSPFSQSSQTNS